MIFSFEKLNVWKKSCNFTVAIYRLTSDFPASEKYGLVSQLRRASVSIASNIAEGSSRNTNKDQKRFYMMAFSSSMEVLNQLIISKELNFVDEENYQLLRIELEHITNMLNRLHSPRD